MTDVQVLAVGAMVVSDPATPQVASKGRRGSAVVDEHCDAIIVGAWLLHGSLLSAFQRIQQPHAYAHCRRAHASEISCRTRIWHARREQTSGLSSSLWMDKWSSHGEFCAELRHFPVAQWTTARMARRAGLCRRCSGWPAGGGSPSTTASGRCRCTAVQAASHLAVFCRTISLRQHNIFWW
jgi:hypothetical protein